MCCSSLSCCPFPRPGTGHSPGCSRRWPGNPGQGHKAPSGDRPRGKHRTQSQAGDISPATCLGDTLSHAALTQRLEVFGLDGGAEPSPSLQNLTKSLRQGSNQISKGFRWPSQNTTESAFSTPRGISMRLSVGKLRHPAMK